MRYEKIIMGQSRCEEALQVVPALYRYKCDWCKLWVWVKLMYFNYLL